MKLGIVPINVGGPELVERLLPLASYAESAGIESVWTFEHVMVPMDYDSKYPYAKTGKMPIAPEGWFIDPLIALTYVAAVTKTLRLGTGVNILPQTNPLALAKQAASLDVLSGGRLILGVGSGWLKEEYDALGVPFQRRGKRMDDYIDAIRKVWAGDVVEHQSEFIQWRNFKSHPTPVQKPNIPMVIGGTSDAALRRVVARGDGWYAPSNGIDDLKPLLAKLRQFAAEAGRNPDELEISTTWLIGREPDALPAYRDLGVSRLVVPLAATGQQDWRAAVDLIAAAAR